MEYSGAYESHLEETILYEAHLEGANLYEAHLEDADLTGANLRGVDLQRAILDRTSLEDANLEGADLRESSLGGANLYRARLAGADIRGVNLTAVRPYTLEPEQIQQAIGDRATRLPFPEPPLWWDQGLPKNDWLTVGTYITEAFKPAMSFSVAIHGWECSNHYPWGVRLRNIESTSEYARYGGGWSLDFLNVRAMKMYDRENPNIGGISPWSGEIITWFQESEYFSVDDPVPITIGGVPGTQISFQVTSVPSTQPTRYPFPSVRVYSMPGGNNYYLHQGSSYQATELNDVGGEVVLILIGGPTTDLDKYLPQAQEILESIEWRAEQSFSDRY